MLRRLNVPQPGCHRLSKTSMPPHSLHGAGLRASVPFLLGEGHFRPELQSVKCVA